MNSITDFLNATKVLIENDADINTQDNEGQTPLHKAVRKGTKENIFGLMICISNTLRICHKLIN